MKKQLHDGGPAFPQAPIKWNDGSGDCVATGSTGMSLRDWFAGRALAASDWGNWDMAWPDKGQEIAQKCYWLADAMLAARKKSSHA